MINTKTLPEEHKKVDIVEDDLRIIYPNILETLLLDRTTGKNILWATHNYEDLWVEYSFNRPINIELITGICTKVIMPRVLKNKGLQLSRTKGMAEVYTPSWVCNEQINSIDNSWFGKEGVFNKKTIKNNVISWKTNNNIIEFPIDKDWMDYISEVRLEITCWEAPYIASRYDTTTGKFIEVVDRIWILDRKLRVVNENTDTEEKWLIATEITYKSIYAYEYHWDSLLLAREAILYTFIDNFYMKFNKYPDIDDIKNIANIISWNIWQMDGLSWITPNESKDEGEYIFCKIMDWKKKNSKTKKYGFKTNFIDLYKNR